jgi:hypothetical protein
MRKQSASRTVKLAGLKSVVHMAELTGRSREYLHSAYNNDKEMFNALLKQAVEKVNR